jgi:protein SCO1/2
MAITQALDAPGPDAEGIQPVFITIDPERDNKVLADYVFAFHHSLVGLTGSPEEIRKSPTPTRRFTQKCRTNGVGNTRSTTPASSIGWAAPASISGLCLRRPIPTD